MRSAPYILVSMVVVALVGGCGKTRPKPSVWDMYDVRHPVPAGSQVPVSQATQYDKYIDNDEYYTPPDSIYPTDPD